jgi:carbon-monoxide dehydrogenase large subunit
MVEDVGRIVNPLTLHGQAIGAMVQGLGGAFLEHMIYDENAQVVAGTLADYLLPQSSNFPNIRAIMQGEKKSPINPLGAKGGGEGGILPCGGLMANAVASALSSYGIQPNQLPLSPTYIWGLINMRSKLRSADLEAKD